MAKRQRSKPTTAAKVHGKQSTKAKTTAKSQIRTNVKTKPKINTTKETQSRGKAKTQSKEKAKSKDKRQSKGVSTAKASAQRGMRTDARISKTPKASVAQPGYKPKRRITSKQPPKQTPPSLGTKASRGASAADKRAEMTKKGARGGAVTPSPSQPEARESGSELEKRPAVPKKRKMGTAAVSVPDARAEAQGGADTEERQVEVAKKRVVQPVVSLAAATAAAAFLKEATAAAAVGPASMSGREWGGLKKRLRTFVEKGVLTEFMGRTIAKKLEKAEQESDKVDRRKQEEADRESRKIEEYRRKVADREEKKAEQLRQREEREAEKFAAKVSAVGSRRSERLAERHVDEIVDHTSSKKPASVRQSERSEENSKLNTAAIAKVKKELVEGRQTFLRKSDPKRPVRTSDLWNSYRPEGVNAHQWTKMFRSLSPEERTQICEATRHVRIYESLIQGEEPKSKKAAASQRKSSASSASSRASVPSAPAAVMPPMSPSAMPPTSPSLRVPREGDSSPSPDPAMPRPRVVVRHVVRRPGADGEPDRFEPELRQQLLAQIEEPQPSKQPEPMQLEESGAQQPSEQPIAKRSDAEQPAAEKLDSEQPDAPQAGAEHPAAKQPGAEQRDTEHLDTKQKDAAAPASEHSDSKQLDAKQPDVEQLNIVQPGAERTDAEQVVAEQSDTEGTEPNRIDVAGPQDENEPASASREDAHLPEAEDWNAEPLERCQQEANTLEQDQAHSPQFEARGAPTDSMEPMSITSQTPPISGLTSPGPP